jgi:hypothetical protein
MVIITSHLTPSKNASTSPVLFDVDPFYSLDRIACQPPSTSLPHRKFVPPPTSSFTRAFSHTPPLTEIARPKMTHSPVSEALTAAINSGLAASANVSRIQAPVLKDLSLPARPISPKNEARIVLDIKDSLLLLQQKARPHSGSGQPTRHGHYRTFLSRDRCAKM